MVVPNLIVGVVGAVLRVGADVIILTLMPFCTVYHPCSVTAFIWRYTQGYYDNSCSLSESALNRWYNLFANTRLYHDHFHGFTHKCGPLFKLGRSSSTVTGHNTSMSESGNDFSEVLRPTLQALGSMTRCCLFVEQLFFIFNVRKRERYAQKQKNLGELELTSEV